VIDQTKAYSVEPAGSPEEIPVDVLVGEEKTIASTSIPRTSS
jgi:hypothetical protein